MATLYSEVEDDYGDVLATLRDRESRRSKKKEEEEKGRKAMKGAEEAAKARMSEQIENNKEKEEEAKAKANSEKEAEAKAKAESEEASRIQREEKERQEKAAREKEVEQFPLKKKESSEEIQRKMEFKEKQIEDFYKMCPTGELALLPKKKATKVTFSETNSWKKYNKEESLHENNEFIFEKKSRKSEKEDKKLSKALYGNFDRARLLNPKSASSSSSEEDSESSSSSSSSSDDDDVDSNEEKAKKSARTNTNKSAEEETEPIVHECPESNDEIIKVVQNVVEEVAQKTSLTDATTSDKKNSSNSDKVLTMFQEQAEQNWSNLARQVKENRTTLLIMICRRARTQGGSACTGPSSKISRKEKLAVVKSVVSVYGWFDEFFSSPSQSFEELAEEEQETKPTVCSSYSLFSPQFQGKLNRWRSKIIAGKLRKLPINKSKASQSKTEARYIYIGAAHWACNQLINFEEEAEEEKEKEEEEEEKKEEKKEDKPSVSEEFEFDLNETFESNNHNSEESLIESDETSQSLLTTNNKIQLSLRQILINLKILTSSESKIAASDKSYSEEESESESIATDESDDCPESSESFGDYCTLKSASSPQSQLHSLSACSTPRTSSNCLTFHQISNSIGDDENREENQSITTIYCILCFFFVLIASLLFLRLKDSSLLSYFSICFFLLLIFVI